jgi:histidyl-tRNA synthetase
MQFDADTVGSSSPAADAEMCMMAADTMEALGIPRGSYVVKVSNRKLLEGLKESLSVVGPIDEMKWLAVLRAVDKLDRLGPEAVAQLLTKGRKDESGDFTKGADLSSPQADNVMRFLGYSQDDTSGRSIYRLDPLLNEEATNNSARLDWMKASVAYGPIGEQGDQELRDISFLAQKAGYDESRILVDRTVVRGLEYYTGPVFEVELTFPTKDGTRFGSVGGGGRYDGLVSRFRGEPVPATGFSIGVSRLAAALQHLGKLESKPATGPVVVTVFDRDRLADYQQMVSRLRSADPPIRAELYLGNPKNLGNQLKYADRRNAPCVVIQGSDEKAKGEVTIKDLIVGAELAKLEKGRDEHLQKQAEAQISVAEDKLVDGVRQILARHGLATY